ncbi:hypothetical protein ABZ801_00705 [Actinomadura sp. NPDC047616]|uniref:hypothetical protein n=1 Tax=Actinomadura sp. NPDC047616 TaxID=3155914 RepID=UPI0033F83F83
MIDFTERTPSADRLCKQVVDSIEESAAGTEDQLAEALGELLVLRSLCGSDYGLQRARLHAFKRRVAEGLQNGNNPRNLDNYIEDAASFAAEGRYDGFAHAALARSALQILLEDFAEWNLIDEERRADLAGIDEDLQDTAEDAPPVDAKYVPPNLPPTHWWWSAPKRTDMSDEERRLRLSGRDLYMFETYG